MSYGAEFRNEAGELILDDGFAMYERARGFTHKPRSYQYVTPVNGRIHEYLEPTASFTQISGGTRLPRGRFISAGELDRDYGTTGNSPPYIRSFISPSELWDYGDIAFYRLADGRVYFYSGVGFSDGVIEGTFHYVFHDQASSEIEYRMASRTISAVPTEGYGLQTFGPSGELTFDSRHKQIPILKNLYVAASDIYPVLTTGNPFNIPIGMGIPDAWIATPQWTNWYHHYQYGEYNSSWTVGIAQTADNMLQIQRISAPGFGNYYDPSFTSFTHDATILVAPPPPA